MCLEEVEVWVGVGGAGGVPIDQIRPGRQEAREAATQPTRHQQAKLRHSRCNFISKRATWSTKSSSARKPAQLRRQRGEESLGIGILSRLTVPVTFPLHARNASSRVGCRRSALRISRSKAEIHRRQAAVHPRASPGEKPRWSISGPHPERNTTAVVETKPTKPPQHSAERLSAAHTRCAPAESRAGHREALDS